MSEAEKIMKLLKLEREKVTLDSDIFYALEKRLPYANTVDVERLRRGNSKISDISSTGISEALGENS